MKQLIRFLYLFAIVSTFIAITVPVNAGGYVYSGTRKKINCGVLVVNGGTSQPLNSGWHSIPGVGDLFYLLDRSVELKPAGWSLENPLAPGGTSSGILKNDSNYWKIYLDSAGDLSMMHVLYLPASGSVNLSEIDKEKLREFVDGGGVLWIDNTGTSPLDFNNSFFITDFSFANNLDTVYDIPLVRHHPLLTIPNWLGDQDVAMLGSAWGKYYCNPGYKVWDTTQPLNFDILLPVVARANSSNPSVVANAYGSGRIVATSNFVGKGCYSSYPYNLPNIKFAFNSIAWASSWTHLRKNPRHNGYSIDTVGGTKLSESWSASVPATSESAKVESAPVIYKNIVFYSSGITLYAFDLMPLEDLDHDGNPDDGIQGPALNVGNEKGRDLIWKWSEGGVLSSPTIVTVQSPSNPGASVDAVLVMSSSGKVYMLEAFPTTTPPTGGIPPRLNDVTTIIDQFETKVLPSAANPTPTTTDNPNPSPPIYDNGWIYATDGDGRLHAYNPGLRIWSLAHTPGVEFKWTIPSDNTTAELRSGPCFGFVKNATSGATVGMLYWFVSKLTTIGVTNNEQNDHVLGVPVRVSNDRLRVRQVSAQPIDGKWRTEFQTSYPDALISKAPDPIVRFTPPISGAAIKYEYTNCDINGITSTRSSIVVETAAPIPTTTTAYGTYALDYSTPGNIVTLKSARIRQPLEPRSNTTPTVVPPTRIAATPALGPDNMMFLNGTREGTVPGSVYGIFNDGSTQITKWHSLLHSGTDVPSTSGSSVTNIPPVVKYKDSTGAWNSILNMQAATSPVVAGNKIFVTATGSDGKGALLCYKANPDFVIRIMESVGYAQGGKPQKRPKKLINATTNSKMRIKIWQPNLLDKDPTGGSSVVVQPLTAGVSVPPEMIDYERGTITFDNFDRLKLRGSGPSGVMQTGIFSTSLPVWVFLDNLEVPIDYSTWGPGINIAGLAATPSTSDSVDLSGWNNLLWYYVVPNSPISSSPVVIGNLVYFMADNGTMYALNTETGESTSTQTAQTPTWQQSFGGSASSANVSVAGSNGVLVVPTSNALHAFHNPATLVADSSRILELDGAGEISWSLDSISWPVSTPASKTDTSALATRSGPISDPARVRYTENGEIILVNTGANQVCKINKGGFIGIENINGNYIRWIYDKFSDPRHVLRPGQPLQLLNPTDALLWQEVENGVLVYHCLVADSGNYRVLDLVYRISGNTLLNADALRDPATGYCLPEVNWVSNTDSTNGRFIYNSIQLIPTTRTIAGVNAICNEVWAAMSNYRTDTETSNYQPGTDLIGGKGLGGAIVALGYRQRAEFDDPWNYAVPTYSGQIVARCDRAIWTSGAKPIPVASPRFFQVSEKFDASHPQGRYLLICDNHGVYEVGPLGGTDPPSVVTSGGRPMALTDVDYRLMPRELIERETGKVHMDSLLTPPKPLLVPIGAPLRATSVQELPMNGNWLISNGYTGTDSMDVPGAVMVNPHPNKFSGEVFEYDPVNNKIVWSSPTLYISLITVGYDNSTGAPIMEYHPNTREQALKNSYVLQQPRSALRVH